MKPEETTARGAERLPWKDRLAQASRGFPPDGEKAAALVRDDFATNTFIPDFDKTISVIRSRGVSVSVILQSVSQLEALYGHAKAATIMNNCDNCLYLGGQDVDTARFIAVKANRTVDTILSLPLNEAWLFTRGRCPKKVRRYDLSAHALYPEVTRAREECPSAAG